MAEQVTFKRNVGLFLAVMIGIGAMMGPGIFALPGEVARMVGPLGILAYLAMGVMTLLTALNYAELGAAIPLAGGGYSFTSRTLPKPLAFFTGWFFWIGNTLACAMYVVIFAVTIRTYFWPQANIALISLVTTVVFTLVNLRGMSEAIKIITVMNLIELAVLLGVGVLGAFHIEPANLEPLAPMGLGPFVPAMALIYVSFVGFELITVASEEIINPGKNIPRSILITLGVATVIYVGVVGVMMTAVSYSDLAKSEVPFIFVADRLFGAWGRWAAVTATIMASLSAFSVTLGASARVLFALGRDAHFPKFFATLHHRYRTPHIALLVCAVVVVAFASSGIVRFVASVADFGYLMGLGIVNLAVIALHQRMPNLRRPFRVRYYPWIPITGAISCWVFVPYLELRAFALGGALTVLGAGIYLIRAENRAELGRLPKLAHRFISLITAKRRRRMRVLIVHGGKLGRNIADRLLAKDEYRLVFRSAEHQITFIDENEQRCQELEHRYNVPIYQGDGTKQELLEQVGVDNIDIIIAASEDDGRNLMTALQAKRLGIKRVLAIVQDPDYVPLLEDNGVVAVSAPWATAGLVEDLLERPGAADLFEIGKGVAGVVEVTVPEGAKVDGRRIQELEIPDETVVAAIIRGDDYVVPRGNTKVVAGDLVVFVGPTADIKKVSESFAKKK